MLDFSIVYHVSTGENPAFYQEIMELRAKDILRRILVNTFNILSSFFDTNMYCRTNNPVMFTSRSNSSITNSWLLKTCKTWKEHWIFYPMEAKVFCTLKRFCISQLWCFEPNNLNECSPNTNVSLAHKFCTHLLIFR